MKEMKNHTFSFPSLKMPRRAFLEVTNTKKSSHWYRTEATMLEVEQAKYVSDYTIRLVFNNGKTGTANLEKMIFDDNRPIFSKLKEKSRFRKFQVRNNTVVWSDELDLASEYLFYLAFKHDPDLQEQFRAWGYVA